MILGVAAIFVGAGMWTFKKITETPAAVLGEGRKLAQEVGGRAVEVAQAFREGTVRQEFFSSAAELSGTARLQVATLKQREIFRREEGGSTMWGVVPVPKVVVQADAPVEYTYFADLKGAWEFRQENRVITVRPPALEPGTPALDVSALTFYTIEGRIWPDEKVRERLRETFTGTLQTRAVQNIALVREIGRREIAEFVEKWLADKFGDAREYHVKVIFPEELPMPEKEKPLP